MRRSCYHKVEDAYRIETRRGWLLSADGAIDDPHRLARLFVRQWRYQGKRTPRFYRDEWLKWTDRAYRPVSDSELNSRLGAVIKKEFDRINEFAVKKWIEAGGKDDKGKDVEKPQPQKVTRNLVSNVVLALQSITLLSGRMEAPSWIGAQGPFPAAELLPMQNGLLHLPTAAKFTSDGREDDGSVEQSRFLLPPTPLFFSTYALEFDFNLDAPEPLEWHRFLESVWPNDLASIDTLQEWFGYCLLPDTRQQKILALIGPSAPEKTPSAGFSVILSAQRTQQARHWPVSPIPSGSLRSLASPLRSSRMPGSRGEPTPASSSSGCSQSAVKGGSQWIANFSKSGRCGFLLGSC